MRRERVRNCNRLRSIGQKRLRDSNLAGTIDIYGWHDRLESGHASVGEVILRVTDSNAKVNRQKLLLLTGAN